MWWNATCTTNYTVSLWKMGSGFCWPYQSIEEMNWCMLYHHCYRLLDSMGRGHTCKRLYCCNSSPFPLWECRHKIWLSQNPNQRPRYAFGKQVNCWTDCRIPIPTQENHTLPSLSKWNYRSIQQAIRKCADQSMQCAQRWLGLESLSSIMGL